MVARLTGRLVTDPSDASGGNLLDLQRRGYSEIIIAVVDLADDKLP